MKAEYMNYKFEYGWYSVRVRLGKTAKAVEISLTDHRNWSYRAWHGKMQDILKAQEQVRRLPDIQ